MSKIEGKGAFSEFWQKRKEHVVGDGVDGKGKTAEEINHIHAASIFPPRLISSISPFLIPSYFQYFTPDLQKIYTDISAVSVTLCNSACIAHIRVHPFLHPLW